MLSHKHHTSAGRGVGALLILGLLASWAAAVDIQPVFDANVTPEQREVINAKVALWESRLPHQSPEHVVTITFRNGDLGAKARWAGPGVEPVRAALEDKWTEPTTLGETDSFTNNADGRPTGARITMNNNPAVPWYVGTAEPVPADKFDYYTVINHEMAHALGFTVNNPRFRRNVTNLPTGQRRYTGNGPGGVPSGTLTPADEGTHLDGGSHPGDLMNPEIPKGVRRKPSALDEDILEDDVWRYPQIQGSLSNFDVWNRSGLIANDFKVTLGGILAGSISNLYEGILNPFGPGTVVQDGDSTTIKWGPGFGQVNPGGSAHFGFRIAGDLTPLSFVFEWTQNGAVIATVPVNGSTWRTLATGGVQNRIVNETEEVRWVMRSMYISPVPLPLEELVRFSPVYLDRVIIDPLPVPILPFEVLTFDFPMLGPDAATVVMISEFIDEGPGVPGDVIGIWFDAAELGHTQVYRIGDLNCDGAIDTADIDGFVLALVDPAHYAAMFPHCDYMLADCNGDGAVDTADIDSFVMLIVGG
jgi:hypothetical protein